MPGGMGGMGGMMGMFGGMGGMGRGMGGMMGGMGRSMMGGANGGQTAQTQTQTAADEYDVDRWQRADGLDNVSAIEQVRADWDKYEEKKKARLPSIFKRRNTGANKVPKTAEQTEAPAPQSAPRRQERASAAAPTTAAAAPPPPVQTPDRIPPTPAAEAGWKSCIGLSTPASIDGFFQTSPINSTFLAVDTLALGPMVFSQVMPPRREEPVQTPAAPQADEGSYMEGVRQGNEQRKYDVRIVG